MISSSQCTGLLTSTAQVVGGKNRINAITFLGDGTNTSTLIIYDNTSASGKVLAKLVNKATDQQNHVIFTNPVLAEKGLFASLSGTGGNYIVYFGG
jgi:hypothetical protein